MRGRSLTTVELAQFGPDADGTIYSLVRFLKNDGGHYNLECLETGSAVYSVLGGSNEQAVFAVIAYAANGVKWMIDLFAIELGEWMVEEIGKEHRLISLNLTKDHSSELDPRMYGILLWTLIELFGFDPDEHMSFFATFLLQLPAIVRDGALDRFRAEPVMEFLNDFIGYRQELQGWDDADLYEYEEAISEMGLKALMALHRLDESLVSDEEEGIPASLRSTDGSQSISWELTIDGLEPVEVTLQLPSPASESESILWVLGSESNARLAVGTDLMTALETARLVMEESDWEPWYAQTVTRYAIDPQISLDIDIEPYLLLDTATPYVWTDEAFLEFLKAM